MEEAVIKIAVVDDHTLFRKGLIQLFSLFPNLEVIIEAANGQKLLEQLEKTQEMPDICLLDINMPGLNGYKTNVCNCREMEGSKSACSFHA